MIYARSAFYTYLHYKYKIAVFDDLYKYYTFRSGGLCKRGPLTVSFDHIYTLDLIPVLTKIICKLIQF